MYFDVVDRIPLRLARSHRPRDLLGGIGRREGRGELSTKLEIADAVVGRAAFRPPARFPTGAAAGDGLRAVADLRRANAHVL